MIRKEEVYKIGVINKPHGVRGEVSFTFSDDIFDRADCDYLVLLLDGIFVPFFIEEYRFKSSNVALVKFEGVDTAEKARMFTNVEVYFPIRYAEEDGDAALSWNIFLITMAIPSRYRKQNNPSLITINSRCAVRRPIAKRSKSREIHRRAISQKNR